MKFLCIMSAERCTCLYKTICIDRGTRKTMFPSFVDCLLHHTMGIGGVWHCGKSRPWKAASVTPITCNIYSSYKFHPYSRLVCRQKYASHYVYRLLLCTQKKIQNINNAKTYISPQYIGIQSGGSTLPIGYSNRMVFSTSIMRFVYFFIF